MAELAEFTKVRRAHEGVILAKPNVVGVGIGYKVRRGQTTDELSIVIMVRQKLPEAGLDAEALLPPVIDGLGTDVIEVGDLRALQARTDRWRPAPGGVSLGHYQVTAGTFGSVVRDRTTGDRLILSNNHVLANSNNAQLGDAILQPGPADGGTSADQIGTLAEFVPIAFDGGAPPGGCLPQLMSLLGIAPRKPVQVNEPGNNKVDCALARPTTPDLVNPDILNIGVPIGAGTATLGTQLQKSGRTTRHTTGTVLQIDVTVTVNYGGPIATFTGQLMAGAMSQGGDSGSAVLDMSKRVVGLLFAGSASTTIINPIQFVLDALSVEIVT